MQDGKQIAGGIFHDIAIMPHNEIFIPYVQKLFRCGTTLSAHFIKVEKLLGTVHRHIYGMVFIIN